MAAFAHIKCDSFISHLVALKSQQQTPLSFRQYKFTVHIQTGDKLKERTEQWFCYTVEAFIYFTGIALDSTCLFRDTMARRMI